MGNWGRTLWKLSQLGLVVLLVSVAVVSLLNPLKEELDERDRKEKKGGQGSTELMRSQQQFPEGHVPLGRLLAVAGVNKESGTLAEGTTNVQQLVFWEIVGDDIYYRIVLLPYDRPAHELMMDSAEALFMSFHAPDDQRVVPVSAPARIATRKLRVATKDGYAAGWFHDGIVPLAGQDPDRVDHSKVGWIFSGTLHARLKKIQAPKGPDGELITDPFGIGAAAE